MSKILDSNNFGLKIYNRFPLKYREDDIKENFALKRYLEALSDGGYKHTIEEINGITYLIDPDKVQADVLPILFKQYGLEVFNGVPENYLRYLLPRLGEAWSKKGSLSVAEFITSSLSGIKTTTNVTYDSSDNPIIDVKLEMDYNIGDYFPDVEQFKRLLSNFTPFYSDVNLIYSYMFYEDKVLNGKLSDKMIIKDHSEDSRLFRTLLGWKEENTAVLGKATLGKLLLNSSEGCADDNKDYIVSKISESSKMSYYGSDENAVINDETYLLNEDLITNGLSTYDLITTNGITEIVY